MEAGTSGGELLRKGARGRSRLRRQPSAGQKRRGWKPILWGPPDWEVPQVFGAAFHSAARNPKNLPRQSAARAGSLRLDKVSRKPTNVEPWPTVFPPVLQSGPPSLIRQAFRVPCKKAPAPHFHQIYK